MALQKYTQVEVYINGSKLSEATSVSVDFDSKAQIVETLTKGFAGVSDGARAIMISVSNAVPSATFEYDPSTVIKTLEPVEITLYAAGKTLATDGVVMKASFGGAVNSPSGISFDVYCTYAVWE